MALANVYDSSMRQAVYPFIEAETHGIETCVPAPPPPGTSSKGAVELAIVLTAAGLIAPLADIIWRAYDKFIAPHKAANDDAGIYLVIPTSDGPLEFWVGNQYRDRKLFVEEFTAKLASVRDSGRDGQATDRVVAEVRLSGHWVRCK